LLLAALGAVLVLRGLWQAGETAEAPALRPMAAVAGGLVLFGAALSQLGLGLATFLLVMVARLAMPDPRPAEAMVMAAILALFAWTVFILGLKLTIPALPWFMEG